MRVTLISVYESVTVYALRLLSAVLKQAGLETRLVLLPREAEGLPWDGFRYPYPEPVLDQLADLVADSGLIGISLMTNYFANAVQITQCLRRATDAPIVWGGIHPTVRPEECLEHADLVCIGEGEDALLDLAQRLAQGQGYEGIDNLWYRQEGTIVRTPLRPLQDDLDAYPYPDYDLRENFVLDQDRIRSLTTDLLLHHACWPHGSDSVPVYETMMSRGCSCRCTYCCNDALRGIYGPQWRVRRRSVGHLIGELRQVMDRFPGFQLIRFIDDEFASDRETIERFCAVYRRTLRVPLDIVGVRPSMVDEDRIGLLVDAGLRSLHVGLQTGSMHTMHHIYRRPVRREQIVQATQVLHQFIGRIDPPVYDVIVDNPWETEQDRLETLAMLLEIPRPYRLQLFSLTFYPGTELYERARQEGLLKDERLEVYQKHYLLQTRSTYINGLFELRQAQQVPSWLIAFLMSDRMRRLNWTGLLSSLLAVFGFAQLVAKSWRALLRWDWMWLARQASYWRRSRQ